MTYAKSFEPMGFNLETALMKAEKTRLQGRIVSTASNMVVNTLRELTGSTDCKITGNDTSKLAGDRVFDGIVRIKASVNDHGYRKEIEIPFKVEKSVIKSADKYIIKKKLASIQPTGTKHLGDIDRMATMLQAQKDVEDALQKEASEIENESQIYKNLKKDEIKKEAKEITIPMDGANVADKDVKKTIRYNKANMLQENIEEGDIIHIGGRSYKVSNEPDGFGKEDSGFWVLTLQEGK